MSKVIFETAVGDIAGIVNGDKSNPLIIVLHGYGAKSSYRNWDYIYKPLAKLNYFVVGLDMPGFGKSPGKKHKSRSEYMRIPGGPVSVVENIINLLNKPSAYILGYDWGCGIAISACIKLNNESQQNKINGLMLFHIAYTQQQENEIINYINCKTLILWVDVEQNHPIKVFNNEWKNAFHGADTKIFQCRPYSADKPKNCYKSISKQVIETISKWLNKNPAITEQKDEIKEVEPVKKINTANKKAAKKSNVKSKKLQKPEKQKVEDPIDSVAKNIKAVTKTEIKEEIEEKKEESKIIKKKKRKKTMSGVRIRAINIERVKEEMKTDYGELVEIKTRSGKIVCVIYGDKKDKPYLALHGWGHHSWSRDLQWQFGVIQKMGYFIIAPDMPGFGRTCGQRHSSRSATNFDDCGPVQIIEDILKYFGLIDKKINVFGYSWGGGIAVSLALSSSIKKNIDKLVLFHPSYSEQKRNELNGIICKKIIIIWIPTDLVHPIRLGRYFHKVFPKHEYHELNCGKYVKHGDGKHAWEKFSDKILPLITNFLKK